MLRRQHTDDVHAEVFRVAVKLKWSTEELASFITKNRGTAKLEKALNRIKNDRRF
tara:strand:- start:504 stop:668 length:165 start_codon:yes stop_codon:yes gene_type:complete